jgi:ribonuclease BN (tRNA processing enzyme)
MESLVRLLVLGSAGSYPAPASACSSYLLQHDGYQLLIDAGNGSMSNLYNFTTPRNLDAVFLSHPHIDHLADFVGIYHYRKYVSASKERLKVFAGSETLGLLESLVGSEMYDIVDATVLDNEARFEAGPFVASVAKMAHPVQTFGLRVESGGKVFAYSADTGPCASLEAISEEADFLLCESTWVEDSDSHPKDLHMTVSQAVSAARNANAKKLVITHVAYPNSPFVALARAREIGELPVEHAFELEEHSI